VTRPRRSQSIIDSAFFLVIFLFRFEGMEFTTVATVEKVAQEKGCIRLAGPEG